LLLLSFIVCMNAMSQSAHLTFLSDVDVTLWLYYPIDNSYNILVESEGGDLKANEVFSYELDVKDFSFVKCQLAGITHFDLLLFPSDSIHITYEENHFSFSGANAAGMSYLTFDWSYPYVMDIDSLFGEYGKNKNSIGSIDQRVEEMKFREKTAVADLYKQGNVTLEYAKLLDLYGSIFFDHCLYLKYERLALSENKSSRVRQDSVFIHNKVNEIFARMPEYHSDLLKVPRYMYHIIDYLTYPTTKGDISIPEGYSADDFRIVLPYLRLPRESHPVIFGFSLLLELHFGFESLHREGLYAYLKNHFPDSEYVNVLTEKLQEIPEVLEEADDIFFLEGEISSLEDLVHLPELAGKYLFIDLWASWCAPCQVEFSYKKQLSSLLSEYTHIESVYISIDDTRMEEAWKKKIASFHLSGYHLRSSQGLMEELEDLLYQGTPFTIPRYLLVDTQGKILNDNLPRPSDPTNLRKALDEWLEKK
ncbi:MAG: redoxin family protein, partial [Bacteroides sp.]|nr:redoxin family protein [Bacteroides sp.]